MSEEYLPFTDEERKMAHSNASYFAQFGSDRGFSSKANAILLLRYEATVRHVEKCVEAALDTGTELSRRFAKAETERDAYKAVVDAILAGGRHPEMVILYLEQQIKALRSLPNPSPGGALAAAGCFAGLLGDEPSEHAIRRLRDGTPAPESTKTIAELEAERCRCRGGGDRWVR